jgi:hypothetical protein
MGRQENLKRLDQAWKSVDRADTYILYLLTKAEYAGHQQLAQALEASHEMLIEVKKLLYFCYELMKG